jgi:hypothetical protein
VLLMLMFPGGLIMTVWLLVKGVNVQKWNAKVNAARASQLAMIQDEPSV